MMGQQKRPLEVGGSAQFVKCLKQSASRSKEASEWLKANLDVADEDSEQLDLDHTGKDISGPSSKERSLHEELAFLKTPKGDASKAPQVGVSTESSIFISPVQNSSSDLGSSHPEENLCKDFQAEIPCSEGVSLLVRDEKDTGGKATDTHLNAQYAPSGKETTIEHKSCEGEVAFHDPLGVESTNKELLANFTFVKIVQNALEARKVKAYRPLPAMVGDKEVNLFLLSRMVKGIGGYTKVTEGGSWREISEGLGFGSDCGPCLKLIYVKYLKLLESGKILGPNLCTFDQGIVSSEALNPKPSAVDQLEKQVCQSTSDEALNVATEFRSATTSRHDPLCDAVRWIRRVALEPGNPKKGQGLKHFQRNEHWTEYCATLASNMCSCLRKNIASNAHLRR